MKHNVIVQDLEQRIRQSHPTSLLMVEEEYDIYNEHGEMDVGLIHPHISYLIEVKSKDTPKNYKKAKHQLWKDKRFLMKNYYSDKIHCFYAHTDTSMKRGYNVEEIEI